MNYNSTHSSPGLHRIALSRLYANSLLALCFVVSNGIFSTTAFAQSVIEPPTIGQETKGAPAIAEVPAADSVGSVKATTSTADKNTEQVKPTKGIDSLLGKATITESKRDSGQRYLIELKHSSGSKQYIEETDSDGKIESTSNDIEETPNLAKWKIGSW
jgi:hypothetical protein